MSLHRFTLLIIFLLVVNPVFSKTVFLVSSELDKIQGSGGLKIATWGQALGLIENGHEAKVIMPAYTKVLNNLDNYTGIKKSETFVVNLGHQNEVHASFRVIEFEHPQDKRVKVQMVEHRPAQGYSNYFENNIEEFTYTIHESPGESFGFFAKAWVQFLSQTNDSIQPDFIFLEDHHSGFFAPFLEMRKESILHGNLKGKIPHIISQVHNAQYQGIYSNYLLSWLGINSKFHSAMMMGDSINALKSAVELSDFTHFVSSNYMKEVMDSRFGAGNESIYQRKAREFRTGGNLNGIDTKQWDPSLIDKNYQSVLPFSFSADEQLNKDMGRANLLNKYFPDSYGENTQIITLTSRIAKQKGFEYFWGADGFIERVIHDPEIDFKFLITGDAYNDSSEGVYFRNKLIELSDRFPHIVKYFPFSDNLEKEFIYYSNIYFQGSIFEPSGQSQMMAQNVGTIPVLSNVGGHSDSVTIGETGFLFDIIYHDDGRVNYTQTSIRAHKALNQAYQVWLDKNRLHDFRKNMMLKPKGWKEVVSGGIIQVMKYVDSQGPEQLQGKRFERIIPVSELLKEIKLNCSYLF